MVTATISITAAEFATFNKLKAEIASLERRKKEIIKKWENENGLPVACKATEGEYILVDGNGNEVGKATISYSAGYEVKPFFKRTIS